MAKKKRPKKPAKPEAKASKAKPAKAKPKPKRASAKSAEEIERQSAVVQFPVDGMGDDQDFERRLRLEKLLGSALSAASLGSCDGGDGGSGTMNVFLGITDPPGARECIIQTLTKSGNAHDTVVAYSNDASTGQYDVWWPANYPYTFTIFGPYWKGPLPKAELDAMPADLRAIQGMWRVTRYDADDGSQMNSWWEKVRFMVVRDRLTMRHGVAIVSDAQITLSERTKPRHIDIAPTHGPNSGNPAFGVYRVAGDTFEFCVNPQGEDRPAELRPEAEHQSGRLVLQREVHSASRPFPRALLPGARYARLSVAPPSPRPSLPEHPCSVARDGQVTLDGAHIMADLPADETRREFMQTAGAVAATAALGTSSVNAAEDKKPGEGIPTRPLGKTGVNVSILCLGGWHIGSVKDKDEAVKIMHTAIDEGVTFFDNCWDYHDGGSEEIMGKALASDGGKWRKKVFLMTKVCARDAKTVRAQIDESLKRLKTDVIDLMQMHEINWDNDPEWIKEQGGLAALLAAQKAGKVRFVGYTGHKSPHIHLKMLPLHKWDTVQCPINVCDHFYRSFAKELIPEAKKQGTAVIGMKSLGGGDGKIVKAGVATAEECIRFSLSQDIAALVSGMDSMEVLKKNIATARNFKPLEGEELTKLLGKVKPHAGDGRHERFKSTIDFDGPYHRKQHGFDEPPPK